MKKILLEKDVGGSAADRAELIATYAGNPLALKIVAHTIYDLFGGEVRPFIEQGDVIFGGVYELLKGQFGRLSALQQTVMLWLAIVREPSTLDELSALLIAPNHRGRLLEAISALRHRSLVEHGQKQGSFTLQSVVLEFVTTQFISDVTDEIRIGNMSRLIEHGFELAQAREYVRQTQERLIVRPILARLQSEYPQRTTVEGQLLVRLAELSTYTAYNQGYGPANLIALLRRERGDLRGLDLSRLLLRNVHFQGVDMQDATLSGSTLQDSIFNETFDTVTAVALSDVGANWAAGSRHGEIRIWGDGTTVLHRVWRAHTDLVYALAFSPDGRLLASSGSWDGSVKVWDVTRNTLLWSGRHANQAHGIAFSPDGRLLASSGNDATVYIWDMQQATPYQTLTHSARVSGIAWTPDGRQFMTGDEKGVIRRWAIDSAEPAQCLQTLTGHSKMVEGLAFSPDGSILGSASWDGTVKLWSMPDGALLQTLLGHAERVTRIVWSSDGRTLVTGSRDRTIRLWDLESGVCRSVLQGHKAGIFGLSFTSDDRNLLSGSEDGTLRLWDIDSGQCLRIIQGYSTSVYDVDWSPDDTHLVSGGSDFRVVIWDASTGEASQLLAAQSNVVIGVGWRADGRQLASSEWNNALRLWDVASGECIQVMQQDDPSASFFDRLAWSPDGQRLACGTFRRGVLVYEMGGGQPHWQEHLGLWIRNVAWSLDSQRIAGAGADGKVYVYNADGELLLRLGDHHSTIMGIAWSPDGRYVASGSRGIDGGELFIWDADSGERVASISAHPEIVYTLAWGPSADVVVTGGDDGTLCGWNVQTGVCLWRREAHQGTVQSVRLSRDGTKLASGGDDGAIMLWDAYTGDHLRTLRRDRPYERLNITGIRGLTEAQKATLRDLGAIEDPSVIGR